MMSDYSLAALGLGLITIGGIWISKHGVTVRHNPSISTPDIDIMVFQRNIQR